MRATSAASAGWLVARRVVGGSAADAVERELEAVPRQLGQARQHGIVRRHRGGDLEHGAFARQEGVDVARQHGGVDVQEAGGVADRARQSQLGSMGDHGGGGVKSRRKPRSRPPGSRGTCSGQLADVRLADRRAAEQ